MEDLTRPAVHDDPQPQRDVFLAHLEHPDCRVYVAELDGEGARAFHGLIFLEKLPTDPLACCFNC